MNNLNPILPPSKYIISELFNANGTCRKYLVQLLAKFTNKLSKDVITKMYHMIKSGESDQEIIDFLSKNRIQIKAMDSKKRADRISNILIEFLNKSQIIDNYLDVGCNNGLITVEFGKKLGLSSDKIFGIDVQNFSEQKIIPVDGFVFKQFDGYHIPYPDNYFDLITCSMTLHHVKYTYILMAEIRRVLKINGMILIKEHNAFSDKIKWLIYLEHMLYDVMDYGITYDNFVEKYYQKTFSQKQMIELFQEYALEPKKISDQKFLNKYHYNNPTQSYYALFVKFDI